MLLLIMEGMRPARFLTILIVLVKECDGGPNLIPDLLTGDLVG
jgi:hypothetical protein